MEKEFVPYDMALRLKNLGFDEPCLATYVKSEFLGYPETTFCLSVKENIEAGHTKNSNHFIALPDCASAPTFSQAFRWFREKFGLLHELVSVQENSWLITIVDLNSKSVNGVYMKRINLDDIDENVPSTYEEAELACLDKLIEIAEKYK
jgi:hypothetical protein